MSQSEATLNSKPRSRGGWITDPITIAAVALVMTGIVAIADRGSLSGLVLCAALLAGWSSAWSP